MRIVLNVSHEPAHAHRANGRGAGGRRRRSTTSPSTAPTSSPPSRALRERGARVRRRSRANYYDDLLARFALDPALVERLRRLGILYDRDDAGEYLHLYSDRFAERFFFEIVQRKGYDAYGALNAPARMASQEQTDAERASPARR